MTGSILPNDSNERIDRLETLMERLIDVNLSTQNQIGFLAGTLKDTRQSLVKMDDRFSHIESELVETNRALAETNRKIDIILQHITGMGN